MNALEKIDARKESTRPIRLGGKVHRVVEIIRGGYV